MAWDYTQFSNRAGLVYDKYKSGNGWFKWGDIPQGEDEKTLHIRNAWKLYQKASQNTLKFLILGDDKIRKSPDLLMNFGLASGGGIDPKEKDVVELVKEQQQNRMAVAAGVAQSHKDGKLVQVGGAEKVVGSGSILNDRYWSPLLNDSYIVAGVHGRQEFQWAAEGAAKEFAPKLAGRKEFEVTGAEWCELWKSYVPGTKPAGSADPEHRCFWGANGIPRVFGREVIGLKTFGYIPLFTQTNVTFRPIQSKVQIDATFEAYLEALAAVGFGSGNSAKAKIDAELGEFLFGDDKVVL